MTIAIPPTYGKTMTVEYAEDVARDLFKMIDREIEIVVSLTSQQGAEFPRSSIEDLRDTANRLAIAISRSLAGIPSPSGGEIVAHVTAHATEFARAAAAMHAAKGPK